MQKKRKSFSVLTVLLLIALFVAACGGGEQTQNATVTPTPDPNEFITYKLGIHEKAMNAPEVGELPNDQMLHVTLTAKTNEDLLNQLGEEKGEKDKERNLEDLAGELGLTDEEYKRIEDFFGVDGATVKMNKLHTSVTVDVKAETLEKLLDINFVYREFEGRKFYTPNKSELLLPRFVVDNIVAITGLDNFSKMPDFKARNQEIKEQLNRNLKNWNPKIPAQEPCAPADPLMHTSDEVASVYGYTDFWANNYYGEGMTINLMEFETFSVPDVEHYLTCVGYSGQITVKNVGPEPVLTGEEAEALLDIEMIAGLAPAADMVVYQTALPDELTAYDFWSAFNDQLLAIIDDNANVKGPGYISISWGTSEDYVNYDIMKVLAQNFRILVEAEHMTIFVASGDCGAYGSGNYGSLAADVPSAVPWVTSVGGTEMVLDDNGQRLQEEVWYDDKNTETCRNTWGSGGGLSTYFKLPPWQAGEGVDNEYSNGMRQIPDVAAVAYDLPIYIAGNWYPSGGTSASAPIWSAGMALINQYLIDQTNYYVYGPSVFYTVADGAIEEEPYYDIIVGDNHYYPATPGWDFTTGLGVPNLPGVANVLVRLLSEM